MSETITNNSYSSIIEYNKTFITSPYTSGRAGKYIYGKIISLVENTVNVYRVEFLSTYTDNNPEVQECGIGKAFSNTLFTNNSSIKLPQQFSQTDTNFTANKMILMRIKDLNSTTVSRYLIVSKDSSIYAIKADGSNNFTVPTGYNYIFNNISSTELSTITNKTAKSLTCSDTALLSTLLTNFIVIDGLVTNLNAGIPIPVSAIFPLVVDLNVSAKVFGEEIKYDSFDYMLDIKFSKTGSYISIVDLILSNSKVVINGPTYTDVKVSKKPTNSTLTINSEKSLDNCIKEVMTDILNINNLICDLGADTATQIVNFKNDFFGSGNILNNYSDTSNTIRNTSISKNNIPASLMSIAEQYTSIRSIPANRQIPFVEGDTIVLLMNLIISKEADTATNLFLNNNTKYSQSEAIKTVTASTDNSSEFYKKKLGIKLVCVN